MKRTLHLKREALGALDDADLGAVVGGYVYTREGGGLSCGGLVNCVATMLSCGCIDLSQLTCHCNTLPNC